MPAPNSPEAEPELTKPISEFCRTVSWQLTEQIAAAAFTNLTNREENQSFEADCFSTRATRQSIIYFPSYFV